MSYDIEKLEALAAEVLEQSEAMETEETDEVEGEEKVAFRLPQKHQVKGFASRAAGKVKSVLTGEQARGGYATMKQEAKKGKVALKLSKNKTMSEGGRKLAKDKAKRYTTARKETAKGVAKTVGAYGAMAGAAGYGAKKAMDKRSSAETPAFDALAEERALEILAENGIEVEVETEKVASDADMLLEAVEARAIEMLEAAGYEFETESDETDAE